MLYHYTCAHGRLGITTRGMIRPHRQPVLGDIALVWLTDMGDPDRFGLGLTSDLLSCDRLQFRYVIHDTTSAYPYLDWVRGRFGPERACLEGGLRKPERWWISEESVLGVLDRLWAGPATGEAPSRKD